MDLPGVKRSVAWRLHVARRQMAALRASVPLETRDIRLISGAGYPLRARLTRPVGAGPLPGLVISPAIHQGVTELETSQSAVTPGEVARLGYAVLTHDPAGRGESWGEEDFGGPEHQDDVRVAVEALLTTPGVSSVGVLSLSYGVVAAVGALARGGADLPVRWLVDWEGPSDREIITTGGTRLVPAAGHRLDDDGYWRPREPSRHLSRLRCGYVRLQAWPDHAQPQELRHADRMLEAASTGGLPWFQVNDHPRGERPLRPNWIGPGPGAANRAILSKLSELR